MQQPAITSNTRRAVALWLLVCAAMVFAMVVVGGVTRLTHSGLSIVEWQPLVGTVPPLSEADWQDEFAKYRQTPEFKQVNHDMDLAGFKRIFWWEYFHRLLGRTIGAVFLLPFLWFAVRRRIDRPLAWQLAGIFALGALQGALGWYMVKSGLIDDPRVSHFRLTAHLGVALAILAAELWVALGLLLPRAARAPHPRLAALRARARRDSVRHGAQRRLRRRAARGQGLQQLPAHERPLRAARDHDARAVVPRTSSTTWRRCSSCTARSPGC